ncbi:hypothetical protein K491DRAFT_134288 [Lophiostoma macrostomum CBS 122681]|uniref:Uncharacterized protein n=1 Tax=Lophiostoma macrostomum CBS 122681 TaxID=1314788 RepID=A0A6A6TLE6_9PLEO|nr:hypothetical protein K491DRAFT_134288 [Lophiostoma macrostomum CBS 122681]
MTTNNPPTPLSLPRELRNAIYQPFLPASFPGFLYQSLRLTCHLLKSEFDEEVLHFMTPYFQHLATTLNAPYRYTIHNALLPNMLPSMTHETRTTPGLSVTVRVPSTFAESRVLHITFLEQGVREAALRRILPIDENDYQDRVLGARADSRLRAPALVRCGQALIR